MAFGPEWEHGGVTLDLRTLLELRTWTVFDADDDGRVLAGHDGSGSMQLVELDIDGTPTPLTALPGACSGRYLPGERAVVVQYDDGGNERSQLSLLRLDPSPPEPVGLDGIEPLVRDEEFIHTLLDVRPGVVVYATNRRNGVDFDVVVRRLADGSESVRYDSGGVVDEVGLDGDRAAVTVLSLQPASTHVRVTGPTGIRDVTHVDDHAKHHGARLLDDGSLVLASNHDREFLAVARVDADGSWTWLIEADDHDVWVSVAPDGRRLLATHHIDGGCALAVHDVDGRHAYDVALPAYGVTTTRWSAGGRYVAIGLVAPTLPGEVLRLDVESGEVRTLASAADEMPPGVREACVEPTSHRVPTRDGEQIPCFVYAPRDGDPDGSVVINIHGGPEAQAQRVFNPVVQALVAAGHVVLVPNVRGSTGYGKRWYSLDDGKLRLDSVADLADLRSWVSTVGGDPRRIALYGGSYGGYMVLAGLSMQPNLWAAGVDVVGMSSLVTFLENTSAYRRAVREREYGWLDADREFLIEASPLTHLDAIRTPLFVIHGANDPRVPLSESEQIKAALDAKGVPCELVVFADEGHGLAKRVNRLDAYPAAFAFLAEHLAR
jgi:dipeptidyl aminopeptidase/acylaminoacyl peptidase